MGRTSASAAGASSTVPTTSGAGSHGVTIGIYGSDVTLCGITIRGVHWTIVPGQPECDDSQRETLQQPVQNDDGINPCSSQDVLITDCFIRSDDDCVA